MNSYLMLGTELGLPGLLCFVTYVGLALKQKPEARSRKSESKALGIGHRALDSSKTACRAGAVVLLVAFWFDGGLFDLAPASVFWILLELGTETKRPKAETTKAEHEINCSLAASPRKNTNESSHC